MFFSCNVLNVNSLECISMSNQEFKVRPEIINNNSDEPSIYPYIVKQVNAVVVVIISMIHMEKCVFLILWKT